VSAKTAPKTVQLRAQKKTTPTLIITQRNYDSFFPHQAFMRNVVNQSKKTMNTCPKKQNTFAKSCKSCKKQK
jgi:hypothetical protein